MNLLAFLTLPTIAVALHRGLSNPAFGMQATPLSGPLSAAALHPMGVSGGAHLVDASAYDNLKTWFGVTSDPTQVSRANIPGYDLHANDDPTRVKPGVAEDIQQYTSNDELPLWQPQTTSEIDAEIDKHVEDGWNNECARRETPEFEKFEGDFIEQTEYIKSGNQDFIGKRFFRDNAWSPFTATPMVLKSFETSSDTNPRGYVMKAITAMKNPTFVLGALKYVESNSIPIFGDLNIEYRVCGYIEYGKRIVATKGEGGSWNNFWLAEKVDDPTAQHTKIKQEGHSAWQKMDIGSIKYSLKNKDVGTVEVTIKDPGALQ